MATVALDVMGCDAGVGQAVEGAARLSREDVPVQVLLVGDEREIGAALAERSHDPARLAVVHAGGCIPQGAPPRQAIESTPGASVLVAADLVAGGEADALVSAGNTGALILAASSRFGRLPGVRRAALAAVHPTELRHGPRHDPFALMLDVGATLTCRPEDLVGFAALGSAYARVVSGNERPSVALLSNGAEPEKGTPCIVRAHQMLRRMDGLYFAGNVEGLDIPRGTVDVVVCEGFLGNVVLKMLEGVSEVFRDLARDAWGRRFLWRMGLRMLAQGLRQVRTMTDWKQYGGAPLLGLDHVVIKAHGRSNARAFRNALRVAAKAVEGDLAGEVARLLPPPAGGAGAGESGP